MLDAILAQARASDYDFRRTAWPDDPLAHLFEEWVPYYRLKWAVARVLQPASILEIGVRFGYSAAAFLSAAPSARYLGLDADSDVSGGVPGAIHWAARTLRQRFDARFVVVDTQSLDRLPGGPYDLVHVDGRQDGDATFRDLELALPRARHVLLDGFLWTRLNFLAASEFLFRHARELELFAVIPGYAGELLLRVRDGGGARTVSVPGAPSHATSVGLRDAYTREYYLQDCGGYEAWKRDRGTALADPRLQAVAALAGLRRGGRALDLGCGRGELVRHLAERGFAVTGVDYSPDAIELARETCAGLPAGSVELLCGDACAVPLTGTYDLALAADLVEHLAPAELDALLARVAARLASDGVLVLHTFPNLWYYRYGHPRRRRIAASAGAWLPSDPRSRYERLMHVNEQSPRTLRRALARAFEHVVVWAADVLEPAGCLAKRFGRRELREAPDLFACASQAPLDLHEILRRMRMEPLPADALPGLAVRIRGRPEEVARSRLFQAELEIDNATGAVLHSYPPHPVHAAYHWVDAGDGSVVVFDGRRTRLLPPLEPGSRTLRTIDVQAPERAGRFRLRATLVQELVRWLDEPPVGAVDEVVITVR